MDVNQINKPELDLSGLIGKLKNEDTRNQRMTNTFQWIMFIMAPLYFIIFIVNSFTSQPWHENVGFLFFSVAFLLFAFIFRKYYLEYSQIDYGLPMVEMLEKAVKRYEFWQRKTGLVIGPVILVDFGVSFSTIGHFLEVEPLTRILIIQAVYLPTMFTAIMVGYFIWRHRQKPIRDKARELLKEIRA